MRLGFIIIILFMIWLNVEKITKERLSKLDQGYWKSEDGTWKKKL